MAPIDRPQPTAVGAESTALWLSTQLIAPLPERAVRAARTADGRHALRQICHVLGCPNEAGALEQAMGSGSVEDVTVRLHRRHVAVFEGIFGARSCQPYASLWDGTDRLCGPAVLRMQNILRKLDLRLAPDVAELPDHIGIQLAALAAAMQQKRPDIVAEIVLELGWVDRFAKALSAQEGPAFHGIVGRLLRAYVQHISSRGAAGAQGRAWIADSSHQQTGQGSAPALEG